MVFLHIFLRLKVTVRLRKMSTSKTLISLYFFLVNSVVDTKLFTHIFKTMGHIFDNVAGVEGDPQH